MPAPAGTRFIHRSHPLVGTLADGLLERTLADAGLEPDQAATGAAALGRAGCWVSAAVNTLTTVLLLRLRHQLSQADAESGDALLVEEATAVALQSNATGANQLVSGAEPLDWLTAPPSETVDDRVREQRVAAALAQWTTWQPALEAFARDRANVLLTDHQRVRAAARTPGRARYQVKPLLPVDVIGVFVLLPPLDL